jgi:hypothetical protein
MKNNSTSTKKPFCKVCFDAGKDSAHPLRNAAGQTVCTYLLSLRCNNCNKSGHTTKYCKAPKKFIQQQQQHATDARMPAERMPAERMPAVQMAPPKQEKPKQEKPKQKSHFDAFQKLMQEEEEKEEQRESEELARRLKEIAHKTNFPDISEKKVAKKASDSILTGWSKIAGKPIKVYETISEEHAQPSKKEEAQPSKKEEAQSQSAYSSDFSAYSGKSWADWD